MKQTVAANPEVCVRKLVSSDVKDAKLNPIVGKGRTISPPKYLAEVLAITSGIQW